MFTLQLALKIDQQVSNLNRACEQHSHIAIFLWNFQKYSVKFIYAIIECVRDFQNNALWDTHEHALLAL